MNYELWKKVFTYTNNIKYPLNNNVYMSDKVLKKRVMQNFVVNKFLCRWIDHNQDDPIDILDDMLLNYYMWGNDAIEKNNQDLIRIYDIYTKTLISIKKFIEKEMKL